jgi:hypothetical protein
MRNKIAVRTKAEHLESRLMKQQNKNIRTLVLVDGFNTIVEVEVKLLQSVVFSF